MKSIKEISKQFPCGEVYTATDFAGFVERGYFTDYDGCGEYHDGEVMASVDVPFNPATLRKNGNKYPYVVWFNK